MKIVRALPALWMLMWVTSPLQAAPPADPYLLDRTEFFVNINVRKFLDAAAVRRDLNKVREGLKAQKEIQAELEAVGFDPFTDLDTLTVVGTPSEGSDHILVIAHGRFDKKLIAWTQKMLAEHGDRLSVVQERGQQFLALDPPGQAPIIYFGWPEMGTIVASPVKSFVTRAMEIGNGKAQAALHAQAAELLKTLDDSKVISFMALPAAFQDTPHEGLIRGAVGSLGIDDGFHLAVALGARDANAAAQLAKGVTEAMSMIRQRVAMQSHQQKELAPFVSLLAAVKVTQDDDTVNIRADLSKDMLTKATESRTPKAAPTAPRDPARRPPTPKRPPRNP